MANLTISGTLNINGSGLLNTKNIATVDDVNSIFQTIDQLGIQNGKVINEIEPSENGERQFQIQEVPPPTAEELNQIEIQDLKRTLEKYKEDVEQVELFGMQREDYAQKKQACADIVVRLRQLEREVPNE